MQRQHPEHVEDRSPLFRAGVELAVRICARAPFAKTVVGVLIDNATLVQALEILAPRLHRLSSVEHDAPAPSSSEFICGKQSRGTGPDDNGDPIAANLARARSAQIAIGIVAANLS